MKKVAIVIPAFKSRFFEETLNSIANQNCTDFTLYIGDDNSPENLEKIVSKFYDRLDIVYVKFESNLGSTDLIAQWNRCVEMTENEEYIWLFSDDDLMPSGCMQKVKDYLSENNMMCDVFHVNTKVINVKGEIITNKKRIVDFPEKISCAEYVDCMFSAKDNTWGINFIVKRTTIIENGGFISFDLAWNADRANWLKFSYPKGILTVPNTYLEWRYGEENISALKNDFKIVKRKADSRILYFNWLQDFIKEKNIKVETSNTTKFIFILRIVYNDRLLSIKDKIKYFIKYVRVLIFAKNN